MAKVKKNISIKRLNESALKSTYMTMSIEGRLPSVQPKAITTDYYDHKIVDAFKSPSHKIG